MLTVNFRKSVISDVTSVVYDKVNKLLFIDSDIAHFKFENVESLRARIDGDLNELVGGDVFVSGITSITSVKCDDIVCIMDDLDVTNIESNDFKVGESDVKVIPEISVDNSNEEAELITMSKEKGACFEACRVVVKVPECDVFINGAVYDKCIANKLTTYMSLNLLNKKSKYNSVTFENLNVVRHEFVKNNTDYYVPYGSGFEHILKDNEVDKNGVLPMYETEGAAAADFRSSEEVIIPPVKVVDGCVVAKPTLVHTGIKAYMPVDEVLHLYNRSSNPKRGLVLANGVGVVDRDYYNNPSNDGEIMFAFFNFSGKEVKIEKGQAIGQGEFDYFCRPYNKDCVKAVKREGGFGSTGK